MTFSPLLFGVSTMSKAQKSNKEKKKQPAMSPKEKKAAKKLKKDSNIQKDIINNLFAGQ
jgi:hypothetical protein